MTKYNINELLEKKKELENHIIEKEKDINSEELKYMKEDITDHTNAKNNRTLEPRKKINLNEYCHTIFGLIDELAKVKTAIQKYNAEISLGMLQEREQIRRKNAFLAILKPKLIRETQYGKRMNRQDKDGVALEISDFKIEPMFTREEVEKLMNNLASQERKINTEVQRLNLNAQIEL